MADVAVTVTHIQDKGLFRLKWTRTNSPVAGGGFYEIRDALLLERSGAVRRALQEVIDEGRAATREKRKPVYGNRMRELARAGHSLWDAVFSGVTQADRDAVTKIRNWIDRNLEPGKDRITFFVAKVQIPWGLIYDKPVDVRLGGDNPNPKSFPEFWCHKYSAAVHYMELPAEGIGTEWPPATFGMLMGAHPEIWRSAVALLDEREQAALKELLDARQLPRFTLDDLYTDWGGSDRKRKPHGMLNFFCHGDRAALNIGNHVLSASEFERQFQRTEASETDPPTLVFLAACETATGDLDGGFIQATGGPGFCGFVGAEVAIPDLFTLKFLLRFLGRFYGGGRTVAEVMAELREEHWPLSLAFSMCCPHDLRLAAGAPLTIEGENLSYQAVCTTPRSQPGASP